MLNSGERIAGAQLMVSGIGSPLIKTDVSALSNPYCRVYKIYLIHGKQLLHGDSICFSTVISHILKYSRASGMHGFRSVKPRVKDTTDPLPVW